MSTGSGDLLRLKKDQIGPAAEMLARAFGQDPKMDYFAPDEEKRLEIARHHFEFLLRYGLIYGEVYTTSPHLEGVAVWLPAKKVEITLWRALRAGLFRFRKGVGKDALERILSFSEYVDSLHRRHMPGPHHYLFFIGVDPTHQGKGYASRLIRPMLDRLQREGLPSYLVTQNEQNVALYEHYGFRVIEKSLVPGTEVGNWAMVWEGEKNPGSATR
ncbi:N-acetyltransferase [uncultured Methanofollis sp.]|uniref:GNAT family N-acetyltransferase n=1 Tax=uncultured Methanofollis sp. TaxID=262500 RepID=UPI0026382C8A|nr:GNAT family N-acetyltransferase [uncultured Methanofollis sp.]